MKARKTVTHQTTATTETAAEAEDRRRMAKSVAYWMEIQPTTHAKYRKKVDEEIGEKMWEIVMLMRGSKDHGFRFGDDTIDGLIRPVVAQLMTIVRTAPTLLDNQRHEEIFCNFKARIARGDDHFVSFLGMLDTTPPQRRA